MKLANLLLPLLLFVVPAISAQLSLVHVEMINGYPVLRVHYDCKTSLIAAAKILGPTDAWIYKNQVVELDGSTVTIYIEENKLKKVIAKVDVGSDFERVAYDGKRIYVCGHVCKAFDLKGKELWMSNISFGGDIWTPLGLYQNTLLVPTKYGLVAINTTNGKLEYTINTKFEGASFCNDLIGLRGKNWLALVRGRKVIWNLTAAWSPDVAIFSDNCMYLFVSDYNTLYAIRASDGKVMDKYTSNEFLVPLSACYTKGRYIIFAEEFNLSSLSSLLTDFTDLTDILNGIPIIFEAYIFVPSQDLS